MERTRQQREDHERGRTFLDALDKEIGKATGYGKRSLCSLREGIGDTHKEVRDHDHAAAIGRDIRLKEGFMTWPHTRDLVGPLVGLPPIHIHARREPHDYQRSGADKGASYIPKNQRGMDDFVTGDITQGQGLREALARGAILSQAPEEPKQSLVQRFREAREVRQYDKGLENFGKFLDMGIPDSVKRRNTARAVEQNEDNEHSR